MMESSINSHITFQKGECWVLLIIYLPQYKNFTLTDFDNEIKDYIHSTGHLNTLMVIPKMVFGLTSEYVCFKKHVHKCTYLFDFLDKTNKPLMLSTISSSKTLIGWESTHIIKLKGWDQTIIPKMYIYKIRMGNWKFIRTRMMTSWIKQQEMNQATGEIYIV